MVNSSLLYNETTVISNFSEVCSRQSIEEECFSEEFRICPGCCGIIRFVKEKSEVEIFNPDIDFLFDEFSWIKEKNNWQPESLRRRDACIRMLHPNLPEKIEITSLKDFTEHVIGCHQGFSEFLHEDGVEEINGENDVCSKRISNLMRYLSRKENDYQWNNSGLWDIDSLVPVSTFVSFEDGIPVSYCAVSEYYAFSKNNDLGGAYPEWIVSQTPKNEEGEIMFGSMLQKSDSERYTDHGKQWVIHDLYTFPEYRNLGNATKILNYLRDERELGTDNLLVTAPLSTQSKGLIANFSTRNVVCLADGNSQWTDGELAMGGKSYPRNELDLMDSS